MNGNSIYVGTVRYLGNDNGRGLYGDRPSMYRGVFADEVVRIGMEYPKLQDETFAQIMKQLTGNPGKESNEHGWFLVEHCIRRFAPTSGLSMYLESFIRDHQRDNLLAMFCTTIIKSGKLKVEFQQHKKKLNANVSSAIRGQAMSGWLVKKAISQGGGKLSSNKKRFFVLNADAFNYYKNPEDAGSEVLLGSTKVRNIRRAYAANEQEAIEAGVEGLGFGPLSKADEGLFPFVVETSSGKISLLCADTFELRKTWIERITGSRNSYWKEHSNESEADAKLTRRTRTSRPRTPTRLANTPPTKARGAKLSTRGQGRYTFTTPGL